MSNSTAMARDPDWWRGAVIYQIYPRSFQDSNDDGVGDLGGITRRLPYVASLGVDAIWISPFFTSPMRDFGYDVSDYRGVDPLFGTLADFDALVAEAHRLGLKVMIDQVLSHSSSDHPWFQESRSSKINDRADWYVWADAHPDGTPPNNWLSIFGGSAWEWDPTRCQYFLHNFLSTQPDLNFHNEEVQAELLDICKFWLDRGVNGFRLDTINFYVHDKELRNNPPLPEEKRNPISAPAVNPYTWQDHLYDKNQPENIEFLRKLRSLLNEYDAAAVGEVGDDLHGLEILGQYTSGGDKMQMSYAFELLSPNQPTAGYMAEVMHEVAEKAPEGWVCWAFSNHDVVRHASRWGLSPLRQKLFITLMMCLRGSVCLYQGEELGLPEADLSFDDLQDPYGIQFWPEFKGRDGCRTPMVWEPSDDDHGGFSHAPRTWLPISYDHLHMAVSTQDGDADSTLEHYRRAIALRHAMPVLRTGHIQDVVDEDGVLRFERVEDGARIFAAFNLGEEERRITLPKGRWAPIGADLGAVPPGGDSVTLPPDTLCLVEHVD